MIAYNDDVVMEILSRLPTKSLCRFKCVSKPWSSFISYVSARRKIHLTISGFFMFRKDRFRQGYVSIAPDRDHDSRVFELRLMNLPNWETLNLRHSCNGLILFCRRTADHRFYYVWNPATEEFLALPDPPEPEPFKYAVTYCFLAFDPRRSPHYKLVQFTDCDSERVSVGIYSSMTRSWGKLRVSCPSQLAHFDKRPIFHNEALHMLKDTHLLRFDFRQSTFDLINLPKARTEEVWWRTTWITESRGNLYYALDTVMNRQLRIYMLDAESSLNWILTHTIDGEFLYQHPLVGKAFERFQLVAFNFESEVIFLNINDKILSYHPSNGKLEEVCKLSQHQALLGSANMQFVTHCLESINQSGGKFINFH